MGMGKKENQNMEKENKTPRYLLTTTGEIFETSELTKCNHPRYPKLWFTKGGAPFDEKKASDDLYDLFDQLVVVSVWGDGVERREIIDSVPWLKYDRLKLFYGNIVKVFGAVWRDDGLKYVAVIESQKEPWRKL